LRVNKQRNYGLNVNKKNRELREKKKSNIGLRVKKQRNYGLNVNKKNRELREKKKSNIGLRVNKRRNYALNATKKSNKEFYRKELKNRNSYKNSEKFLKK
jgi:hypothetical protein